MVKIYIKKLNGFFVLLLAVILSFGVASPGEVWAATTPTLGAASTYAVLGSTYTNTSITTINGGVGFVTPPAVAPLGLHTNYGSVVPYATAGIDQSTALALLTSQGCTFTFPAGAVNLSTDTTHGPVSVFTPGVYCSSGAMDIGGPLTLDGDGTYIFRSTGALTSTAGALVELLGASACDIFWTPTEATTLGANTTFIGNLISDAGITLGANTTLIGRALAFGGTITSDTNTITVPDCTPSDVSGTLAGTLSLDIGGTISGTTGGSTFSGDLDGGIGGSIILGDIDGELGGSIALGDLEGGIGGSIIVGDLGGGIEGSTTGGTVGGISGGGSTIGGTVGSSSGEGAFGGSIAGIGSVGSGGGQVLGASTSVGSNNIGQVLGATTYIPGFPATGLEQNSDPSNKYNIFWLILLLSLPFLKYGFFQVVKNT